MRFRPSIRIAIALAAAILFVIGLAYWWQGNLFHEVVGTLFLVALIIHNVTVAYWYSALGRGKWTGRRLYSTAINLLILGLMLALAITSMMVSQTLFTFVPINVGFSAREIHVLIAYWALIALGLHLGLHWARVLAVLTKVTGFGRSRPGVIIARALAVLIAIYGAQSVLVVMLPEKLFAIPALEMWDFTANAGGFFVRYGAIIGLFAVIGHYLALAFHALRRRSQTSS